MGRAAPVNLWRCGPGERCGTAGSCHLRLHVVRSEGRRIGTAAHAAPRAVGRERGGGGIRRRGRSDLPSEARTPLKPLTVRLGRSRRSGHRPFGTWRMDRHRRERRRAGRRMRRGRRHSRRADFPLDPLLRAVNDRVHVRTHPGEAFHEVTRLPSGPGGDAGANTAPGAGLPAPDFTRSPPPPRAGRVRRRSPPRASASAGCGAASPSARRCPAPRQSVCFCGPAVRDSAPRAPAA